MSRGQRKRWTVLLLLPVAAVAGGCSQSSPFLASRTTVGSLKASVSHLDFENRKLQKQVATLQSENRQTENQLTQEESENGDLSARLDDAKDLLRKRGIADSSDAETASTGARMLPAARSSKSRRKAPFAQIPGRIDPLPSADDSTDIRGARTPLDDDLWPQTRPQITPRWLPVAQGSTDSTPKR